MFKMYIVQCKFAVHSIKHEPNMSIEFNYVFAKGIITFAEMKSHTLQIQHSNHYHSELQSNIIPSIGCSFVSQKWFRSISNDVINRYNHIWLTLSLNTNHFACLDRMFWCSHVTCYDVRVSMCHYKNAPTHIRNSFQTHSNYRLMVKSFYCMKNIVFS